MMNYTDLSRTDLNLLILFEAVWRERHVGRAAERLNLTSPAVSHGLGRLRRLLNDPLFLRTPKGVVPTARATEMAEPIADILARVRGVVSTATPFDAASTTRRFTNGAPDGMMLLSPFLAELRRQAPRIDIAIRQLHTAQSGRPALYAWEPLLDDLEARTIDVAIAPLRDVPARFVAKTLYEEDFVIAMRKGHPFARAPNLDRYCEMQHLVVSQTGDPHGLFDEILVKKKRSRRVALTVPTFMQALALVADSDLLCALPRRLVSLHAARFGLMSVETPLPRPRDPICVIATKAATLDAGIAWLCDLLIRTQRSPDVPSTNTQHRSSREH